MNNTKNNLTHTDEEYYKHNRELLIATFATKDAAKDAQKSLKKYSDSRNVKVLKSAIIQKDEKGHTHVDQDQDVSAGEGTVFGAVVGGIIGLVGGPVGAVAGAVAGAATGGTTAAAVNFGFSDDDIKAIKASLAPNTSALVTLVEDKYREDYTRELNRTSSRVWHRTLSDDYYNTRNN
jgi:uncharacterized membrane protein